MISSIVLLALIASFADAKIAPRIVGGKYADEGQFPYIVMLQYDKMFYGAGSIIGKKWVLTAAHCLTVVPSAAYLKVVGGTIKQDGGVPYQVKTFHIHPDYKSEPDTKNDIGLIELEEEIEFTNLIDMIPMNKEDIYNFKTATASGWGHIAPGGPTSEKLKFLEMNIMDKETCNIIKGFSAINDVCFDVEDASTCQGDSGGPLESDGVLIGVTSWGWTPCGKDPAVFARVDKFLPWIQNYMNSEN